MPIYEYECGKCGVFEFTQSIKDAALTKCPTCKRKVTRLISSSSFAFKGSGWYVTDYGKGGSAKSGADGAGKPSGDSGGSTSDSSTSTKPDATPSSPTPAGSTSSGTEK